LSSHAKELQEIKDSLFTTLMSKIQHLIFKKFNQKFEAGTPGRSHDVVNE